MMPKLIKVENYYRLLIRILITQCYDSRQLETVSQQDLNRLFLGSKMKMYFNPTVVLWPM